MSGLIGDEANAQVRFLRERLDLIRAGADVPRVVILEGTPGSGKTRILREFYGSLQRDQATNSMSQGYWPALGDDIALTADGGPDIERMQTNRKLIGPAVQGFQRPPGTLPEYFWWSMDSAQIGSLVELTAGLMPQLSAHLPYLAEQRRKHGHTSVKQVSAAALQQAKDLKADLALEAIGQTLTALDISAPGYGTALAKLWQGGLKLRVRRALTADVARGGTLRIEDSGAGEIVKQLSRLACAQLPVVVVIDDMHSMGSDLADLLDLLAQPSLPILVVGAATAGAQHATYRGWLDAAAASELVEVRGVPALGTSDAERVAAPFAPDGVDLAGIAQRFANPWALTLAMAHPKLGGRLRRGLAPLDHDVPASILDFYRAQWGQLATPVKEVLTVASVAGTGDDVDPLPVLSRGVADAADRLWPKDNAGATGHSEAVPLAVQHRWLDQLDRHGRFLQFDEELHAHIAADTATDLLDDEQRQGILADYAAHVSAWLSSNAQDEGAFNDLEVRIAARTYLDRVKQMPSDKDVLRLAVRAVSEAQTAVNQPQEAEYTWNSFIDPKDIDWTNQADLRDMHTRAVRLWAIGRREDALNVMNAALRHRDEVLGRRHEETMKTRRQLSNWYGTLGEFGRALRLSEALLEDEFATMGVDGKGTLTTRHNIGFWTGQTGRPSQALILLHQLLHDMERILGPDHPDALTARNNIAFFTGQIGDVGQALSQLQQLLPDQQRIFGPDHPDTLSLRNNIGILTGQTGHPQEALGQLQGLLPDCQRILGPNHPSTLTTRFAIAALAREIGDASWALQLLRRLVPDQERILGPDHPDTLTTRADMVLCLWGCGSVSPQEALDHLQQLLPDQERILGPDHPHTLTTRSNIAAWTGQAGRLHQALALLQQLLRDRQRVLGHDHPDTLTTRDNIAALTGQAGRPHQALALLQQLLRDRQRVLEPDHPDTLMTQATVVTLKSVCEALDSDTQHGPSDSAVARVTEAINSESVLATVAALIAGCRAFGTPAMVEAALSQPDGPSAMVTAWLQLIESGYDPWEVGIWWQHPGAALTAGLNAIDEEDREDLRLILQLNPATAQEHGEALHLLLGDRTEPATDSESTALEYIAKWVVPDTPLAERARTIARDS